VAKRDRPDPLARVVGPDGKLDPARAAETIRSLAGIGVLRMNRIQEPFIRIKNRDGRTPRRRILETGEKCLTADTLIDTYRGPQPMWKLYQDGYPFTVWAWDGERRVMADASAPFMKEGIHRCYRIELSNGRWIEGADLHRVLVDGRWRFLEELYESLHGPRGSSSGLFLSVRASGELHLSETPSGFALSCSAGCRLCDEQLQLVRGSDLVSVPSRDDAPQHIRFYERKDDLSNERDDSLLRLRFRRASAPSLFRSVIRTLRSLVEGACRDFRLSPHERQSSPQLSIVGGAQLQSSSEWFESLAPLSSAGVSSVNPPECGINIVAFYPISTQEVYDFTVEKYHNYFAGGLIHHNTGKTRIGICEDIAHSMGFRPWLDENDPDYKINIQVPNQGLVGCETMAQSVEAKIRPEFESLIPAHCAPVWKNDTTGALKSITLRYDYLGRSCGSTIHIRSYNQPADSFRGIDPHWNHWDEPPPRDILIAAERGKVVTNAPSIFTMTPLKEAYIYDMFSVKAFNNGGTDQEISVFHGSMWENCQDWCRACDCYIPQNDPVNLDNPSQRRPVNKCPACGLVMGFIPRAGILEYLKLFTDPDELAAHIEGKYAHLSGLIYKTLSSTEHRYADFEIPKDWMRVEVVDPHDNKPVRWLFAAISPEDIEINGKPANRIYIYAYLLADGNVSEIARKVKVKRAEHNYAGPAFVILDAKYGMRSTRTFDGEACWEEDLGKAGIERIRLSHSDPGDVSLGHKRVKEYLKPHYSRVKDKSIPALMFAEEGTKGERSPWQDMSNYQWERPTEKNPAPDKPQEKYKDFCDCVRYLCLEQPVYEPPNEKMDLIAQFLAGRNETDYKPMGYGLRMS
jgi:hypothetical protein